MNHLNFSKISFSKENRFFSSPFLKERYDVCDEFFLNSMDLRQEKEPDIEVPNDCFLCASCSFFQENKRKRFSCFKSTFYR